MASDDTWSDDVKEAFEDKVDKAIEWIENETQEILQFASAYDDQAD